MRGCIRSSVAGALAATGFCGDVRLDFGIRAHHYPRKVAVKLLRPSAVAVECARLLR